MTSFRILRVVIWLLPLYLAYQLGYQLNVLYGIQNTYQNGEIIAAQVEDFEIKQIAAQTNGYIVLSFTDTQGNEMNRKLSLPVQMAAPLMSYAIVDIRYLHGASMDIVITATYDMQRNMVLVNVSVLLLSLFAVVLIAIWATKFANRKISNPDEVRFVRTDQEPAV